MSGPFRAHNYFRPMIETRSRRAAIGPGVAFAFGLVCLVVGVSALHGADAARAFDAVLPAEWVGRVGIAAAGLWFGLWWGRR